MGIPTSKPELERLVEKCCLCGVPFHDGPVKAREDQDVACTDCGEGIEGSWHYPEEVEYV